MKQWFYALFISTQFSLFSKAYALEKKICIVGAGPAGLAAASELSEMGYEPSQIYVLEKNERVGGKANSVKVHGNVVELGAAIVSPRYHWVRYFADRLGYSFVPHLRIDSLETVEGKKFTIQKLNNYHELPSMINLLSSKNWKIAKEISTYKKLASVALSASQDKISSDFPTIFYTENKRGEKTLKSFAQVLDENDITIIKPWFEFLISSFGYGALNKIPSYYGFLFINDPSILYVVFKEIANTRKVLEGFGELMEGIADLYKDRINLIKGAEISLIEKNENGYILTYGIDSAEKLHCTDLIMATEPKASITRFKEKNTFHKNLIRKIKYMPYRTLLVKSDIPRGAFMLTKESHEYNPGFVTLIANEYYEYPNEDKRDALLYIIEDENTIKDDLNTVLERIKEQFSNYGLSIEDVVLDDEGNPIHRVWANYFPHFLDVDLLKEIDSQQGIDNIYYVGSAYGAFELVEVAMHQSTNVIHRFFQDETHPIPNKDRFKNRSILGIPYW